MRGWWKKQIPCPGRSRKGWQIRGPQQKEAFSFSFHYYYFFFPSWPSLLFSISFTSHQASINHLSKRFTPSWFCHRGLSLSSSRHPTPCNISSNYWGQGIKDMCPSPAYHHHVLNFFTTCACITWTIMFCTHTNFTSPSFFFFFFFFFKKKLIMQTFLRSDRAIDTGVVPARVKSLFMFRT